MKYTKPLRRQINTPQKQSKPSFWLRHPLVVPVVTFIVLFFSGLFLFVMMGASTQGPTDARIVNVFVDEEQQTVTTRAKTVGELLDRLGIKLSKEDIVEPKKTSRIIEDGTQVNIYRARPIEILDGNKILTIMTAQSAPRLVAEEMKIDLLPEDDAYFRRSNLDVLESGASEQLVIDRSVPVQLNVYGVLKQLRTTADTVGELLEKENILPRTDETIQPSKDKKVSKGMLVSVNLPGVRTVALSEKIAHDTETVDDENVYVGESKVKQKGADGVRAVIYEIKKIDGKDVKKKIQVVVTLKPVTEIVLRGTKIKQPYFDPTTNVSGDKIALMSAAGISASDYAYVDFIVSHESNWRPGAINNYSGAYGLCQSLPASKMASAGADYLTNPVTQLRWCSGYASRYGGWAGAYGAWLAQGWW